MRIISGAFRGKKMILPDSKITRPTSDKAKESLFNLLENYLNDREKSWADISFLDGFAGSGAVGIEALSRGCQDVFFVEKSSKIFKVLCQNMPVKARCWNIDLLNIGKAKKPVDIVFLDAPYYQGLIEPALRVLWHKQWIDENTLVVTETESKEPLDVPFLDLLEKREYGRACFSFFHLKQ